MSRPDPRQERMVEVLAIVARLAEVAYARNREVDHEVRTVTLTDDEALLLLALLDAPSPTYPPRTPGTDDS